ncbi:FAD-dependent thymidylate synthase [Selenomonas sp. F0473]|uniref:FAD-dependent thymidylate synthase n=1 Tax=Selenomonas sp. F0473 TaxID=999423 RepID=UPI00029EB3F7|nr:FAD-dependent thymidylate synthase [Selenomonas sp. F0473]EKU71376.1 thymidylate synthase, flavin-dependent [Selenomonas sp. F0473]
MEIKLISKTPNYLRTCWTAARTCYSADSPIELLTQEKTDEEMLRLLDRIMKSKHLSVVEHCAMTFAVKDVSRTLLAQYSRHRIGVSLSVQSQRYVSEQSSKQAGGLFGHVVPQTIMENGEAHVRYMDCMKAIQAAYDELLALGVAKQDARFVLPGGACTNFVTTLNLRSFMDVYEKRVTTPGAQWEIKEMMCRMRDLIVAEEPWLEQYIPRS